MFGIKFIKTRPTDFVLLFKNGIVKAKGPGLSFFYYAPSSNVVVVPSESTDVLFMFKEMTADFQECDIQGQLTYRIIQPEKIALLMDFSVDESGEYTGDGAEKLQNRITGIIQVTIREKLQAIPLIEALSATRTLMDFTRDRLSGSASLTALGIEVIDFSIVKLSPTPEMARALEAATRERLLKNADESIYERRNFAVEQERTIKENELQTQISIEEKNRQIREEQMNVEIAVQQKQRVLEETKMNTAQFLEQKKHEIESQKLESRIALEHKREDLVHAQSKNQVALSRSRAESIRLEIAPLAGLDGVLLDSLLNNQMDVRQIIGRALKDLANNAEKIGTLNISPDLLTALMEAGNDGGTSKKKGA